jgi:hypothetical protein
MSIISKHITKSINGEDYLGKIYYYKCVVDQRFLILLQQQQQQE